MQRHYCLPITQSSQIAVLDTIHGNLPDYQYFEVWLDYIEGLNDAFIRALADELGERLIVLFRRQNLEPIHMDMAQRLQILDQLSNTPVLVDLDVSQVEELAHAQSLENLRLITSYHNYQSTPETKQLTEIVATMETYQPVIYKLATLCVDEVSSLRLLQLLLHLKNDGKQAVIIGMGEAGAITRVFGALWGNALTFAPKEAEQATAPGQLTRDQLEIIFKELA